MSPVSRRRFIVLGSLAMLATWLTACFDKGSSPTPGPSDSDDSRYQALKASLLAESGLFSSAEAVAIIGKEYRASTDLSKPEAQSRLQKTVDSSQLNSAKLRELIRGDFEAGRTVTLSGWVLAQTEALLCAAIN